MLRSRSILTAALLVLATLAVYARALGFGFVGLDDPGYVSENARVLVLANTQKRPRPNA